jgi:DNA-directed RNA polymerase specialized sigma24 family protein
MKSGQDLEFESVTMPHVNALFQTALQLTEDRVVAEELLLEAYDHAWNAFRRRDERIDWRMKLFKILLAGARRRSAKATIQGNSRLSGIPRTLKEIILLVDGQDFSYQEAADILDSSRDAIAEGVALGRSRLEVGGLCKLNS